MTLAHDILIIIFWDAIILYRGLLGLLGLFGGFCDLGTWWISPLVRTSVWTSIAWSMKLQEYKNSSKQSLISLVKKHAKWNHSWKGNGTDALPCFVWIVVIITERVWSHRAIIKKDWISSSFCIWRWTDIHGERSWWSNRFAAAGFNILRIRGWRDGTPQSKWSIHANFMFDIGFYWERQQSFLVMVCLEMSF